MVDAFLGTTSAVLRLRDGALEPLGLEGHSVTALQASDAALLAGTYGDGLFRSDDGGDTWVCGRDAVAAFLRAVPLAPGTRWRMRPTHANGQLAFGHCAWNEPQQTFVAHGICVLTLDGALIAEITNFTNPDLFAHFALPATIGP